MLGWFHCCAGVVGDSELGSSYGNGQNEEKTIPGLLGVRNVGADVHVLLTGPGSALLW